MPEPAPDAHPAPPLPIFALLTSSAGAATAIPTVVPLYFLVNMGVGVARAAAMLTVANLPSIFLFLYAPLTDLWLRRRTWFALVSGLTALLGGWAVAWPSARHLPALTAVLFALEISAELNVAALGGLMNSLLGPEQKARVGSWFQIGNLGGGALLFGILVAWEARVSHHWLAALTVLLCLLPLLALPTVHEPPFRPTPGGLRASLRSIGGELRFVVLRRSAIPVISLLLAPVGTGAITSVLTGTSATYGASPGQLAFANGWGGALFTIAGSAAALLFPARWNRMVPYAITAAIYGVVSLAIAAGPLAPHTLILGMLASNLAQGLSWAAYLSLVLQAAGAGGHCHSSRVGIFDSLGNLPTALMPMLLGVIAGRFGPRLTAAFDGTTNLAVAAAFFTWWAWRRLKAGPTALPETSKLPPGAYAG